jgi:hypothetical protein
MKVKHVIWESTQGSGRVVVYTEAESFGLKNLGGKALPANLLVEVIRAAFGTEFFDEAEKLHRERTEPWKVEHSKGSYGSDNYRVRYIRDERLFDCPWTRGIHISMMGKLNMGITRCPIMDLNPLLEYVSFDFPTPLSWYVVRKVPVEKLIGFNDPGTGSNFIPGDSLTLLEERKDEVNR